MRRTLLLTLLVVACDGTPTPTPQPGGSANYSSALGPGPDFSSAHGLVVVDTWFDYEQTSLSGSFADGPPLSLQVESERIGACRVMTYSASTCQPACTGSDLCIDGTCQSWPERQDRGALRWQWPDGDETVQPDDLHGYYSSGTAKEPGDITIAVDGMSLVAPTVSRPLPDGDWSQQLDKRAPGEDLTLRWTNPIDKARVRVYMTDCVGSHGGIAEAEIECEGPDTGSLVLPGSFLDALQDGDWTHGECGSHDFDRYHAAAPEGDDTIRFVSQADAGFFWFPGR